MSNWLRMLLAILIIILAGAYWYYRSQVVSVQFVPTEIPVGERMAE